MHAYRVNVENPWNLFAVDESLPKTPSLNKFTNVSFTNSTQNFEKFLSNKVPVSFSGKQNVICCKICKVLVVKNRYKEHYDSRHGLCNSKNDMIPFEDEVLHIDKVYNNKKVKRSKKKRCNIKEKLEKCSSDILNKKKTKKIKVKSTNKRLHSKSLFDDIEYANKNKKLKCEFIDNVVDIKHFNERMDDDFLSSSPKHIDDNFYQEKVNVNKSYNPLSINDGLCYSNDSVHRTSSDSSTPPSLSLGTLQTLSSPSSLNILNDLSSVITEHYLLPSNDLSTERSGVSCKYQIDSLPWENLPPVSNKISSTGNLYSLKDKESSFNEIPLIEEDGEIERAVQSITGFYECLPDEFANNSQLSFDLSSEGCKSAILKSETLSIDDINSSNVSLEIKSDMFTGDDGTVIDCFLDEIDNHSIDKDQLCDNNCAGETISNQINNGINQNVVDMFMDDCNNISEFQIDSNLLNIFNSDYEEKFETLINNAMNEFVTQSPQNIVLDNNPKYDRKKSSNNGGKIMQNRSFDPLKHCGVVGSNGQFCYRSLLCKLHTMPQKRLVERSENITSLIKGIRDCNKIKKLNKKSTHASIDSRSSCSKMSCDSFLYNCSSNKSIDEMPSLLENNLSHVDIEEPAFNCNVDSSSILLNRPSSKYSLLDPQPLVIQRFNKEVIVNSNRPHMTMKSHVWRNRPKSQCDPDLLRRFLYNNQTNCVINANNHSDNDVVSFNQNYDPIKATDSGFQESIADSGDIFNSQPLACAPVKTVLTAGTTIFPFDQFCNNYGNTSGFFDVKYSSNNVSENRDNCQKISNIHNTNFQQQLGSCTSSNIYNESLTTISSSNNLQQLNNTKVIPFSRDGVTSISSFLSTSADGSVLSNNKSQISSPRSFNGCTNQLISVNGQHSNADAITNNIITFNDQNSCSSIINTPNQNTSLWNPVLNDNTFSNSNKFISITDERSGTAQMLYPVRNNGGGQIMMVMNKNQKLVSDQVDLTNENFTFSVNQPIPLNSLLTLKQQNSNNNNNNSNNNNNNTNNTTNLSNNGQVSNQSRNINIQQQQSTNVPTQQIVSISPLELQRLTDGLCTNSGQAINTDCVNKSNEIFISSSKSNDKKNQIVYQLNQNQTANQFISSTLSSKVDSNNLPKPLTVQSSTPNGITHRFVILPDGTISAFTQQPNSNLKTNHLNQQQQQQQQQPIINRATIQHPIFSQLSNCGQSQSCFLNGDKLIIAPSQVATNTLSQQIIMPQIINQTELNNQSAASRFALVHPQQKLGATTKTNFNRLSQNNISNQVPLDSSHQKLSFHIQTPNQYQNHTPNTFFLTTAPSGNSNIPLKQQIFLQSNDQIATDFSLIDSSKFVEGQYNTQGKPIHSFENIQCNSDVHTINSSNQDFEFINHVINPQSIIIQQPPVNRLPNQSLSQLSTGNVVQNNFVSQTSQDISNGIDGAHTNVSNNTSTNNQHIVINNCSNEKFAQSQLTLSQRQLSTSFSNASTCNSVVNPNNQSNFKTVPPPLVISQQLLNQSVSNQFVNNNNNNNNNNNSNTKKSFIDVPSYHQQSQQKNSHHNQVTLDENQFSNEFVIMQSMIA